MASSNVFALPASNLNGFLFFGHWHRGKTDYRSLYCPPWPGLGKIHGPRQPVGASMSKDAAGDALAACIAQMPVSPKDLQNAPATAARLVALLFKQNSALNLASKISAAPARGRFSPVLLVYIVIGFGTAVALATFLTTHGPIARWWVTSQTDQKG